MPEEESERLTVGIVGREDSDASRQAALHLYKLLEERDVAIAEPPGSGQPESVGLREPEGAVALIKGEMDWIQTCQGIIVLGGGVRALTRVCLALEFNLPVLLCSWLDGVAALDRDFFLKTRANFVFFFPQQSSLDKELDSFLESL